MVEILKPMGLDKNNKVRWQFPEAGEKVPTVFIQVQAEQLDFSVKDYNAKAKKYLRRYYVCTSPEGPPDLPTHARQRKPLSSV